ncbi:MAG: hypothetical protein CBB68_09760 [Rhodospirillaceae bacterium TMED8]|nr:hypothetical protein [Magnetovibrio sp.]OUT50143.1 MAG: hypothetical protein CBB68_09760 [Rhodospirillaceae bacterium TMED8]|tara:strand:- start:1146 stop:1880 length:735 start_codon:yes stop_codon:yes gene_type:complete
MKWLAKIRFLPLTIFFTALMLSVKIGDIVIGVDGLFGGSVNISVAKAQEGSETARVPEGDGSQPAAEGKADVEEGEVAADKPPADTIDNEPVSRLITDDPTLLTPAEIEILQQLAIRRDQLDGREREMDVRSGLLDAAEGRIEKKIAELQNLRLTIDGLIKKFNAQEDAKLQSLVKIYENMKPKEAAKIFEELETNTLLEISESMKERKLAAIIAKMPPERAREVTVELRRMRELPLTIEQVGG